MRFFFFQCDIVVSISKQQHAHQQCQWKFQCPGDCFYVGHHDIATTWAKQSTQVHSCFSQTLVPMQSMFFIASPPTSSSFKSRFVMFDLHSLMCHKYENPYSDLFVLVDSDRLSCIIPHSIAATIQSGTILQRSSVVPLRMAPNSPQSVGELLVKCRAL